MKQNKLKEEIKNILESETEQKPNEKLRAWAIRNHKNRIDLILALFEKEREMWAGEKKEWAKEVVSDDAKEAWKLERNEQIADLQ